MRIFVECDSKEMEQKVIAEVSKSLSEQRLQGRMTHFFGNVNHPSKLFGSLDVQTKVNKFFEERLGEFFHPNIKEALPNVHVQGNIPDTLMLQETAKLPSFREFLESVSDDLQSGHSSIQRTYETKPTSTSTRFKIRAESSQGFLQFSFI